MEFVHSFLRCHLAEKPAVVAVFSGYPRREMSPERQGGGAVTQRPRAAVLWNIHCIKLHVLHKRI